VVNPAEESFSPPGSKIVNARKSQLIIKPLSPSKSFDERSERDAILKDKFIPSEFTHVVVQVAEHWSFGFTATAGELAVTAQ
jgi:hypothetical protein